MATITATAACPTIPGEIRWFPMAASQTFKKGEFLYLNSAGRLAVCTATPNGIAGIAMEGAQESALLASGLANPLPSGTTLTTTDVVCPITIAKRGQQFTLNVTSSGTATATANTQIGKHYNLYVASNVHYCDVGSSTFVFVVDDIAEDNAVGDTTGRVIVEVTGTKAQLDSGTS